MNLSIVLPAYAEPFLNNTIRSILDNTSDTTEIVPVIDGYEPESLIEDERVRPVIFKHNRGMRKAINVGVLASRGKYVMKMDSHCAVCGGFDKIVEDMQKNWLMVPRRKSLNEETWGVDKRRIVRDYHYFNFPQKLYYGYYMGPASYRGPKDHKKILIDDTMTFQGSCWLADREYFLENILPLDDREEAYGNFYHEHGEIGLKYWLKGGAVKINKKYWYAHLSKRKHHYKAGLFARRYKKNKHSPHAHAYLIKHWLDNEEQGLKHEFSWLVEKFWPLSGWPEDWQEKWEAMRKDVECLL